MLLQVNGQDFNIANRRKLKPELLKKYYALARLNTNLETARRELLTLPDRQRRTQRQKIKRLESQYDRISTEIIKST